ncbi:MAG: potassium/proton antiporter [Acidipropionibacterium acidipropionici]|uniref:K+/H+ antiporter n=2 Tax=Acidipropionibacterium acidipropionici TaxID=1748 RepID=A0A142KH70_9ACTN|nr:potassium/proton antiporter [Acidipropionibacterium acidipropionici]AFV90811.1 TrkA-C domain-containing protein [Acidipropionibacterium acidipropionici ATCC 4875]ALN15042.1 potassium transporter [Acidipropionibacterium acidipropionici]AMS05458.1 K+/H+ antiporter [Acidipropionibacterium acidipropionici]AOZ46933.1 K+/H+ antiporter [Acidipropionibacterium acidipropionici]APZ09207.1 K+/H+ antiporter [Acidipropionibacterium acidipropionici]
MPLFDLDLLVGAAVALLAVFAARVSSRLGLPALLLFLLVGMMLGPLGFGIQFSDAGMAHGLGFAALVLILAEGGLSTKWSSIKPALGVAGLLATVGIGGSIALMAVFAHFALHLPWTVAVLLGAVTAPTDSAAVFSVLRGVSIPTRLRSILEAESGLNDAPTVLVVIAMTGLAAGHQPSGGIPGLIGSIVVELAGGILLGVVMGWIAVRITRRVSLPSSGLYALAALAWAVLAYGVGVWVGVSGFASVYVASVVIGNGRLPYRNATRSFAEGVGWMAQIGLFVMLGLLADLDRLTWTEVLEGVVAGLFLTVIARPLSVALCASWFKMPPRHQAFVSWAGLRGAVPIILATIPLAARIPEAGKLFDIVLVFVVVFTCIQGPTLAAAGRLLGLVDPDAATDVDIEVAPLDEIDAVLLQVHVPVDSHLIGVTVRELRLPRNAFISLIIRADESFVPHASTALMRADELLLVTPEAERRQVEERLTEIGRGGRLARWNGLRVKAEE